MLRCCKVINNLLSAKRYGAGAAPALPAAAEWLWPLQLCCGAWPISCVPHPNLMLCAGADDFTPVLIYVTIRAAPEHLASNLAFIERWVDR